MSSARFESSSRSFASAVLTSHLTLDLAAHPAGRDQDERNTSNSQIPIRTAAHGRPLSFAGLIKLFDYDRAAPLDLLFQNGRRDSNVADADRYHHLATEPKTIKWYDTGRDLDAEARLDRAVWLAQLLELKLPPHPVE